MVPNLRAAVIAGNVHEVRECIKLGLNVDEIAEDGSTPLHEAVSVKHLNIVESPEENKPRFSKEKYHAHLTITEMLLRNRAYVRTHDGQGMTPLHYAVGITTFETKIIKCLLKYGAEINSLCHRGLTPIFYARNGMIIEMLVQEGANVNYVSQTAFTPIAHAIKMRKAELVTSLLENGADLNIEVDNGKTVINMYNVSYYTTEILEILFNHLTNDIAGAFKYHIHQGTHDYNHAYLVAIIVKRVAAKQVVVNSSDLLTDSEKLKYIKPILETCQMEINRMKLIETGILYVSVLDILQMPEHKLMNFAEREGFLKLLNSNLKKDFPCYHRMLKRQMTNAIERRKLCHSGMEALQNLLICHRRFRFPDLVISNVVDFLKMKHLECLTEAYFSRNEE